MEADREAPGGQASPAERGIGTPERTFRRGRKVQGKSCPASEAVKQDQERQKPPRDNAATRLNEILDDLRKAGLTPAELKTYKREAQKATEQVEQPRAAPEKTENPTELKAPTKPKAEDFKTYEEFEAAKDKYFEDVADYKAAKKFEDFQLEQARNAAYQSVQQKLNEAKARYSDDLRRDDHCNVTHSRQRPANTAGSSRKDEPLHKCGLAVGKKRFDEEPYASYYL